MLSNNLASPKGLDAWASPKALDGLASPKALDGLASPKALGDLASPKALDADRDLAFRAVVTLRSLHAARRDIELLEGAHLEFLLRTGAFREFGFAAFSDFVWEVLQESQRSARRLMALHRLAGASPQLAQALSEGRLSKCQALALRPLIGREEDLEPWILMAARCSVADLQQAVLNHTGLKQEEEEPGRRIRFAAPRSAALAWDHGVEWARRMLGWHAPRFLCLEAILSEASSVWMQERIEVTGKNGLAIANEARSRSSLKEHAHCGGTDVFEPKGRLSSETVNALLACLGEAERLLHTLATSAEPPRSGTESVRALKSLRVTERSLRILFVRLLKELEVSGLLAVFGYRTSRQFLTETFKLSERTAARRLREAWLFEGNPKLRNAFQQGAIGLGQAYLIDRVAVGNAVQPFIERARSVTHLYFEREVQFLERLREYVPDVAKRFHGPLPSPGLEEALQDVLRGMGWTDDRIVKELEDYQRWPEPRETQDHHQDPASNPPLLRRLESLLEIIVLAMESRGGDLLPTLATGEVTHSNPRALPTLAAPQTTVCFWAPESVLNLWNAALTAVRKRHGPLPTWAASILLLETALQEWRKVDLRHPRSQRIQERDEWRCQAPGCSARRHLESHHIIFRSQDGSEDPENLITLCHGHHRHGIHDGLLRVRGIAPSALIWELGANREVWTGSKREGIQTS